MLAIFHLHQAPQQVFVKGPLASPFEIHTTPLCKVCPMSSVLSFLSKIQLINTVIISLRKECTPLLNMFIQETILLFILAFFE